MKNKLLQRLESSNKVIRFWWAATIVGILLIIAGLIMMFNPEISYLFLSSIIGIVIFASGVSNLALSTNSHHIITGKMWIFISGIVEVLIGFILIFSIAISAAILPVLLGIWILFKGINMVGVSDDMNIMEIPGAGWTLLMGIMTILCAFIVLSQPLIFGTEAVVIWCSIALIMLGIAVFSYSLQLKKMHKHFE
jgi:uncharacterized membrane protein HdeD (DUF308 family)